MFGDVITKLFTFWILMFNCVAVATRSVSEGMAGALPSHMPHSRGHLQRPQRVPKARCVSAQGCSGGLPVMGISPQKQNGNTEGGGWWGETLAPYPSAGPSELCYLPVCPRSHGGKEPQSPMNVTAHTAYCVTFLLPLFPFATPSLCSLVAPQL